MADSSAQDKNLPASQRKLDKARAEGQVSRSRDLGHFAVMATAAALMTTGLPAAADQLRHWLGRALSFDRSQMLEPAALGDHLGEAALQMLGLIVPFGLAMIGIAVA